MKFFKIDNFGTESEILITDNENITKEQIINELIDICIEEIENRKIDYYNECHDILDAIETFDLFNLLEKRISDVKWIHLYDSNNDFTLHTISETVNSYYTIDDLKQYIITFMDNKTNELKVKRFLGMNEYEVKLKYNESYSNKHYTFISIGHLFE